MHDEVFGGAWVHLSLCAICSRSTVVVSPPPLAHLKWQFVKHGPPLALFLSSKPFPARLLPSLICPSALPFASLVLLPFLPFPSFSLSLLSFPSFSYLLCTLHLLLSPPLCLFISPSLSSPSLFFSHLVSLVHVRFLLHYIFFSPSVLRYSCHLTILYLI